MLRWLRRIVRSLRSGPTSEAGTDEFDDHRGGPWPTDEYVPPEQRVIDLLDRHAGVRRQQEIQESTNWSAAKTSRILSGMEEEGTIVRVSLGRQKVVCLPGSEPRHLVDADRSDESD